MFDHVTETWGHVLHGHATKAEKEEVLVEAAAAAVSLSMLAFGLMRQPGAKAVVSELGLPEAGTDATALRNSKDAVVSEIVKGAGQHANLEGAARLSEESAAPLSDDEVVQTMREAGWSSQQIGPHDVNAARLIMEAAPINGIPFSSDEVVKAMREAGWSPPQISQQNISTARQIMEAGADMKSDHVMTNVMKELGVTDYVSDWRNIAVARDALSREPQKLSKVALSTEPPKLPKFDAWYADWMKRIGADNGSMTADPKIV